MHSLTVGAVSRNYFNLPLWIAQRLGFFADEGLDVRIELYEPIDEVTQRLREGNLDLALGVTEHVILDSERGGHLQIIAGNVNRLPFSLIGRPGVATIADLRGRRIGVSSLDAGSSSLVMQMLAAHGLRYPQDYTIVAVGPILTRWRLLQSGEIDAGLQGAPLNYVALDAGYVSLAEPRAQFPDFQFTSLNVDERWARAHAAETEAFVRAYLRAHVWFFANREGSIPLAVAETGVSEDYAARAWDEYAHEAIFPRDGAASPAAVQALIDVSSLIRALPSRSKTRAEDYIDSRFIEAAARSLRRANGAAMRSA